MTITVKDIVPFGRSRAEYEAMFALTEPDLRGRILGCADGPASFNAETTADGINVVSVDPLYKFPLSAIRTRFEEVIDDILGQVRRSPENWVWSFHAGPDELKATRRQAFEKFAEDFDANRGSSRYVDGELPNLPFRDGEFDLALCSHFLFLYSDRLSLQFHLASILDMLRVAREVRIFPLMTLEHTESPYATTVRDYLEARNVDVKCIPVDYELQRGGNQMLRIRQAPR